ncbi:ATP-binding cassette domain-containing protein [Pedobacter sp. HMF7647]|uniref:ATP-binding cassette domain-containing protein n=1 Tax=Hufsiella arboris TaxID=2695275 RepID=A0A7K1YGX4_9SPHI|nr:ABC-F family ATP-binding cassette domain-containing protein [Hufsiella arboris]MXV53309.1 ATP-binding cassette domain-containing protein [Hufsiella arboris]
MLNLQDITCIHPNKDLLFDDLCLHVGKAEKIALVGNNGAGKSTLLKIIAGTLLPAAGTVFADSEPYYVPQLSEQFNEYSVAEVLNVDKKLSALTNILSGNICDDDFTVLNEDWLIEDKCRNALASWGLENVSPDQQMSSLSGGEKTKVFLAGIFIHQPEIVLMDEPSNHLDRAGRELLYDYIRQSDSTLILVSHDRELLNLVNAVYELSSRGLTFYGGNYDFYTSQKALANQAVNADIRAKEKALRKAKEIKRETAERQQRLDARGKKKQEKAGLPTILQNTLRNNAENSTSRLKGIHNEKVGSISQELSELRKELPLTDKMKFGFGDAILHTGKTLISADEINYKFRNQFIWKQPLKFQITSGERIALKGANGAGKTTLIKLLLGELRPQTGSLQSFGNAFIYVDQDYSLTGGGLTVYEQAQNFNLSGLHEHEVKIRLNRFLFSSEYWDKSCDVLSGGERMRLTLCCLTIRNQAPDMIVLDEPTNNLDIQNMEILTTAANEYQGTLLVVSHDERFLQEVNVRRIIELY